MARQFTIVVDGIPEKYNAEAIKMLLNLGLRNISSNKLAKMFIPKTALPVIKDLDIIHLEEASPKPTSAANLSA